MGPRTIPLDAFFQTSQSALFAVTGGKGKVPVLNKLLDCSYCVQSHEKLTGEATVPDIVISRCQMYKYGTSLSFCSETVLNALVQQNLLDPRLISHAKISAQQGVVDQQWV